MTTNNIITTTSILLFIVGIFHLVRLFYGWEVLINNSEIPIWISLLGTALPLFLSYRLLKTRE